MPGREDTELNIRLLTTTRVFASRAVGDITRKDCRMLIVTCREKGLKITTVRGIVRTLSTVLSQAVEDELLPANPALQMGKYLKRGDDPEAEPDPFTGDEVEHLLAVADAQCPKLYPLPARESSSPSPGRRLADLRTAEAARGAATKRGEGSPLRPAARACRP